MKTIVGQRAVASHIITIAINIAIDISILIMHGATWLFFIFIACTAVFIISAIAQLTTKIEVNERGVVIGKVIHSYNEISHATPGKNKLLLVMMNNKTHKIPITNELEVAEAINFNKATANYHAPQQQAANYYAPQQQATNYHAPQQQATNYHAPQQQAANYHATQQGNDSSASTAALMDYGYCEQCGKQVDNRNSAFCGYCGAQQKKSST